MKKFTRIISVLVALIFVLGCLSVNAFADDEVIVGSAYITDWLDGYRYVITSDACCNYYCASVKSKAGRVEPMGIDSILTEVNLYSQEYDTIYEYVYSDEGDTLLYYERTPDDNCFFRGSAYSEYYILRTEIGSLNPIVYGAYSPEQAED